MSKINNTTAYPIVTPATGDLVILSDVSDSKSTKNFQIGALNDLFIDTFVNPDATDFHIPVFNQGGVRITNSIMSQDSSPSNGVAGTKITIAGDLTLERDQSDTTLTIISDASNIGENNNPSIKFIQDGGSQNAAIGFNIIDDTQPDGLGNRFWIINSMGETGPGDGGITFGTAQVDGWDNAIGRFIIRGDGKGLFGHPDSLYNKTLGSQFEIYDNRDENTTTDPSFSVYSVVDVAAPSGNEGAGGIKQILDVYDNGVFSEQQALMLIPGTSASNFAASTPIAFYTNSDMDTASPSGFAGMIFDSGNWLLDGSGTFTTTDPGYQLKVVGNTNITGDVQIDTLSNNYIPVNNAAGVLRDSGFYQSPSSAVDTAGAISLNTTFADTNYGEVPGLRVASRVSNTPGVIDLFRNDTSVTTGESVGILQYSVLDDGRYTVAQIGVETLSTSGVGDSGGGKFIFKTTRGGQVGAIPESRFELDNGSADFSVPINVTSTAKSSFAGQVTIPITPQVATDAASKAYVDSQSGGIAQTSGSYTPQIIANTPSEWVISSYSIQQGKWVRTGNLIHCDFYISISASNISGNTGGTSSLSIQGWPYNYEGNINDDYQDANLVSAVGFDVKMQSFDISVGSGLGNAKLSLNKQNTAVTNYYIETPMQTGDLNNGNFIRIRGSFSYTTSNTTLNSGATIDP